MNVHCSFSITFSSLFVSCMRVCRDSLDSLGALISMRRFRFWTIVSELQNPFYTMFIVSVKKSIRSLDENVTLMSHLIQRWVSSHIYSDGACFYFIYVWIHPRLFISCWNPFPCLFFLDDNSNVLATCLALRKTLLSVPLTSPIHSQNLCLMPYTISHWRILWFSPMFSNPSCPQLSPFLLVPSLPWDFHAPPILDPHFTRYKPLSLVCTFCWEPGLPSLNLAFLLWEAH